MSVNVFDDVAMTASVTVTVNVFAANAVEGVPLIWPVRPLKLMPDGSVPPLSEKEYGVVPPLAVTGMNAGTAAFTVPVTPATAPTVDNGAPAALTVRVKLFDDVADDASVTVTANVVVVSGAVGVPLIWPVLALNVKPVGSAAPLRANVYGGVPPVAVTGATAGRLALTVPVTAGTTRLVARAGATTNEFDVAGVRPAALKIKVCAPLPMTRRSENVATPFTAVTDVVPPSAPVPLATVAVTIVLAPDTIVLVASRTCTAGEGAKFTPLATLLG